MTFVSDRRPRATRVASCRASGQSKIELGLRWKVGAGRLGDLSRSGYWRRWRRPNKTNKLFPSENLFN